MNYELRHMHRAHTYVRIGMRVCVCMYDTSCCPPNILAVGKHEISDAKFASQNASSLSFDWVVPRSLLPRESIRFCVFFGLAFRVYRVSLLVQFPVSRLPRIKKISTTRISCKIKKKHFYLN